MKIKSLKLKNFRNYADETFTFGDGLNLLSGENAQGKTNAAEAIFFLCTGYSPRANRDKLVVKFGEDSGEITGVADSLYGEVSVKIIFSQSDNKRMFVNGIEVLRISELLGNIHSVFFNPSELKLVQESPEDRRRFMNISLSQMSKTYFRALQSYNKILAQRNNLLKDKDVSLIRETLPVWDAQLCKQAAVIIKARNSFLTEISPIAQEKHAFLSGGREDLALKTESGYFGEEDDIAYALSEDLKTGFERDLRLGFTGIGPHRDDIKFTLNGEDARIYGSQGQQRTIALSLKLAEAETFKARFGEYPVMILDDVLSELDRKRQTKLIDAVSKMQTIFTATGISRSIFKNVPFTHITIKDGSVKSVKEY
ncbi:MAG: DNA replication/repair protein RecF [Clostridia bacterium]|nr:DNA replication/repair protein RecF [Clostridia bacterium]